MFLKRTRFERFEWVRSLASNDVTEFVTKMSDYQTAFVPFPQNDNIFTPDNCRHKVSIVDLDFHAVGRLLILFQINMKVRKIEALDDIHRVECEKPSQICVRSLFTSSSNEAIPSGFMVVACIFIHIKQRKRSGARLSQFVNNKSFLSTDIFCCRNCRCGTMLPAVSVVETGPVLI